MAPAWWGAVIQVVVQQSRATYLERRCNYCGNSEDAAGLRTDARDYSFSIGCWQQGVSERQRLWSVASIARPTKATFEQRSRSTFETM